MFEKLKDRIENWMHPKDKFPSVMLYNLLFGQIDNLPSTEDLETVSGLEIAKRPVQVAVIRVGDNACDLEKLRKIMTSCTVASDSDEVLAVNDGVDQVILIFFCDTLWEEQVRDILEDMQEEFLETWPNSHLYITLGTIEDYVDQGEPAWRKSFKIAIGLQDYRYVKPRRKVIAYSDIIARRKMYPKGIHFQFDLLKEYLESENPDLLRAWLSGIYSIISDEEKDAFGIRYHLTLEIMVNAVSLFREKGLSAETYIGLPEALAEEVLNVDTQHSMQMWTETFLEKCRKVIYESGKVNLLG